MAAEAAADKGVGQIEATLKQIFGTTKDVATEYLDGLAKAILATLQSGDWKGEIFTVSWDEFAKWSAIINIVKGFWWCCKAGIQGAYKWISSYVCKLPQPTELGTVMRELVTGGGAKLSSRRGPRHGTTYVAILPPTTFHDAIHKAANNAH